MTLCVFETRDDGHACVNCNQFVVPLSAMLPIFRNCEHAQFSHGQRELPLIDQPTCRYLGPKDRRVLCPTCKGRVEIKVHSCSLLDVACLPVAATELDGVTACDGCEKKNFGIRLTSIGR